MTHDHPTINPLRPQPADIGHEWRAADIDPAATRRAERQVAGLVRQGMSNRDVAAQLFVSPRTVDFHLRNVIVSQLVARGGLPL